MEKINAEELLNNLRVLHPNAACELNFKTPFELLVAVILSAQCTDKRVNMVTETLFKKYNTPEAFASLKNEELEPWIYATGFYKNKAENIISASKDLLERFSGEIPKNLPDLISLKGVGRKTASVVLAEVFKIPAMPVDTHVFRVSRRLGLSQGKTPEAVEEDLKQFFKKEDWIDAHHLLVFHGRYICKAQTPICEKCNLTKVCLEKRI